MQSSTEGESAGTGASGGSPIRGIQDRLGAARGELAGREVVLDYGDLDAEARALREGVGWYELPGRELLEMSGEDRQRFLNGLVTCEVKELVPGQGTYGFVTSPKGKILADLRVLAADDRFLLSVPAGTGEEMAAHLGKYIIVDRVEIRQVPAPLVLQWSGPCALEVLAAVGGPSEAPELGAHGILELAGGTARWLREADRAGFPRWSLWLPAAAAAAGLEAILDRSRDPEPRAVGQRVVERARILAGEPRFGVDFGPENLPQETGLTEAVSFTKGCYLGQEVVARIHYRGGVNRFLRGLALDAAVGETPELPSSVELEGREVGRLTSYSPAADGRHLGLGILHKRAEIGSEVAVAGGFAEVVDLPFEDDAPA